MLSTFDTGSSQRKTMQLYVIGALFCILLAIFVHSLVEKVLKDDRSGIAERQAKIVSIKSTMERSFGKEEAEKLYQNINKSPESYLNDKKPIVVELSNAIIEERRQNMSMNEKKLYIELQTIHKQLEKLTEKLNQYLKAGQNEGKFSSFFIFFHKTACKSNN